MKTVNDRLALQAMADKDIKRLKQLAPTWERDLLPQQEIPLDFFDKYADKIDWGELRLARVISDAVIWEYRQYIPKTHAYVDNYQLQKKLWDYYAARDMIAQLKAGTFLGLWLVWGYLIWVQL